jgi:hypothetical protein
MAQRWAFLPALLGLGLACGDPLVSDGYRGEPLFRFRGRVESYESLGTETPILRVSLFWSPRGLTQVPARELREQPSTSVSVSFPATFEVRVFQPPEAEDLVEVAPGEPRWGLALVLVYRDLDGDGRFTPDHVPSELMGGAADRALVYAPEALAGERSPTGQPLPRGFTLVSLPIDCSNNLPTQRGTQDCGVRLGAACRVHEDCGPGGGKCLQRLGPYTIPGGLCALAYEPQGCRPLGGTALGVGEVAWLRPCASSLDCPNLGFGCVDLDPSPELACQVCWPRGLLRAPAGQCYAFRNLQGDPDCGQTLGLPCAEDSDCGHDLDAGRCLQSLGGTALPGGYCTLADAYFGCRPYDARYMLVVSGYWLAACAGEADCRTSEGFVCNSFFRVCLPDDPTRLSLRPGFRVERDLQPLCYQAP